MLTSLKSRLLIFLIGFAFVAVLLQVISAVYVFREELIRAENIKISNYVQFSSANYLDAYNKYYATDFWKFRENTRKLRETLPIVEAVQLVDLKGNVLFDTRDQVAKDFRTLAEEDKDILPYLAGANVKFLYQNEDTRNVIQTVVYPIIEDLGFRQYSLVYRISYKPVMEQVLESTFKTFSLILPAMLFLFLLSIFAIFQILKPIALLDDGVRKINNGNLDHRLLIEGGDEIAQIAMGFNKMTQDYKYAMIKSQRVNLLEGELKSRQQALENQFKDLQNKSSEIADFKKALLNLSEDASNARDLAISERDKTLAIINAFSDGILVFDSSDKVILVNPQIEKFFSIRSQDLIGQSVHNFDKFNQLQALDKFFEKGISPIYRQELVIKDDFILEVSVMAVKQGQEVVTKLVIIHDISREKMIEKTKSEFVSIAAHQLRTPLSAIKWIFGMLSDGEWGEVKKEQKEYLQKGYISTERLIRVVNDLLNVSRIEEGRFLSAFAPTKLDELVNDIYLQHQGLAEKKSLKFKLFKPDKPLPLIKADKDAIKIAIENLVENAMNYTHEGGEVDINLSLADKMVKIEVKDSGIGIPAAQQERLFAKFFRGTNALKKETSGSGLGLFVTRNIVESHGGKIWFESTEGKGTSFYFTLPVL